METQGTAASGSGSLCLEGYPLQKRIQVGFIEIPEMDYVCDLGVCLFAELGIKTRVLF